MSVFSASSNFSGCNETGFALGTVAVTPSAAAAPSTGGDHGREQVQVLPMVMPEGELGKVERQVLLGDLVITAHDSALEQSPEGIEVRGVDDATCVLTGAM